MFFALDENKNRVYAEDGVFSNCICPGCGKPVIQRRGDINRHHFAHVKKEAACPYENNADYKNMSDWHIRMQEYFPKEEREHIFIDNKTGEKHIADVYIEEANTVLEFQYSPIKEKEFLDRTNFHIAEGRRIVWLFEESWKDADEQSYNKQQYKNGKLANEYNSRAKGPYSTKSFRWLYRRKCVENGPTVYRPNYSVCVYTGAEGDVFHRIISLYGDSIIVSLHDITMSDKLNSEEFFLLETHWQDQEPWKSYFDGMEEFKPFSQYESPQKRYAYEEFIILKKNRKEIERNHKQAILKEKERLDREDYWTALLEDTERKNRM